MNRSEVFVGIDISELELEIGILPQSQTWKSPNDETGMSELIKRLAELGPELVVMEATGGLERAVHSILEEAGLPVRVVNPRQVRDFAKALGILAKTDAIDALVLAKYAQSVKPEPRPAKDKQTRELEALLKRHCQLVEMLTQEKNRLRTTAKPVRGNLEAHITVLKKYLKEVDKDTRSFIKRMPIWRDKDKIIQSAQGAGPVLSATMLSSVPELGALNRRKIAALIGVAPFNCDSGKFKGRRRCWGGRAGVRSILYMATLAAIRCNVIIRPFYQRLIAAGKDKKVAITACMRKFLTILNTMVRNGAKWNPVRATGL